ncbi:MAG: DNA-deoxyinosine glycosylase [Spirochaetae bacterium HGW-Spirochaetae-8]|jgi:hypoxanthine-DNA glycosylase|nr:MAG: DNA-deoxyinosine glycosylase [Spirochaetae bacterium HGW-Spirochaetae-8]
MENDGDTMLRAFDPIGKPDARILILGTMPSVRSLELGEYYGHSRNTFWPLIASIFQTEFNNYQEKKNLLESHRIALWDVLAACERDGSADSEIKHAVPNDFSHFWREHQQLELICCNGQTALRLFLRLVGIPDFPIVPARPKCIGLPSTSPAFTLGFAQKQAAWSKALEILMD